MPSQQSLFTTSFNQLLRIYRLLYDADSDRALIECCMALAVVSRTLIRRNDLVSSVVLGLVERLICAFNGRTN